MNYPDFLLIHFDGACGPKNPGGIATYGYTVSDTKFNELEAHYGLAYNGGPMATNNVAEYVALGSALRFLLDAEWSGYLTIFGDSQLVVRQISKIYGFRKQHLRTLCKRCWEILDIICPDGYDIGWIPRDKNARADELSKLAYQKISGKKARNWSNK
jgi:ribonuclease HI